MVKVHEIDIKAVRAETAARVRMFRLRCGMTQMSLAEILDVSYQQVQKYENGTSRISVERLTQLAAAFGISRAVLLGDAEEPDMIPTEMSEDCLTCVIHDMTSRVVEGGQTQPRYICQAASLEAGTLRKITGWTCSLKKEA